ncbi:hypothetical protein [Acinetobacter variabilis]|uniref:Luciferase-like domain-containing protein n=1 Tax=Acinetobacter variabilis TaxID=70346 RepID=N8WUC5_9GAMM|nr:hypothetical protein [Acinetobacter variabilis]ENV00489.1 hypothetical protein F969_00529 [Acinetobacter variabilis]
MAKRQIKLGAFIPTTSQHAAGWCHPESRPQEHLSIDYAIELAKTAERGLFDAYFLADGLAVNWSHGASKHNKNVALLHKDLKDSTCLSEQNSSDNLGMRTT